jgi:hypothetical protein
MIDLEEVRSRYLLARMAGGDADYNGWDTSKINAMIRSWQDVAPLHDEVKKLREKLYGSVPRRAME